MRCHLWACACLFSNIVRRRPTDNRTPTPEEMEFYLPILLEEIRLVDPDIIVTLGNAAVVIVGCHQPLPQLPPACCS